MKTKVNTIGNGNITKQAHVVRNELAAKFNVPCRYISFGDCIKVATGERPISRVRNCFGKQLGTKVDKMVHYLVNDPDAPLMFTPAELADVFVDLMPAACVKWHLSKFKIAGFLVERNGYWNVSSDARPYPQPMAV